MKRSGSKPGIQRRRSSGILKLGKLHLRETPKPGRNAIFTFGDGVSTSTTNVLRSNPERDAAVLTGSKATMFSISQPIPLPSSHIHRTNSELNLVMDQNNAALRERAMFQRIVSGMVGRQNPGDVTVSVRTSPKRSIEVRRSSTSSLTKPKRASVQFQDSVTSPQEVAASATARASGGPSESADPAKASRPAVSAGLAGPGEPLDFFVGSYENVKELTSQGRTTSPTLLQMHDAALDLAASVASPGRLDRPEINEYVDAKNDGTDIHGNDKDQSSDNEEVFAIDL
jgi:hypothetical protein